jgi:hypothetical protein
VNICDYAAAVAASAARRAEIAAMPPDQRPNTPCAFCEGKHSMTCLCHKDCGTADCVHARREQGDWLFNPRALAAVPTFAMSVCSKILGGQQ